MIGGGDVDYIYGLGGNDGIAGQGGDFIYGGEGNDSLTSNQLGGNTLVGGLGSNTFRIEETTNEENKRTTILDFGAQSGNKIFFKQDGAVVTGCTVTLTSTEVIDAGCTQSTLFAEFYDNVMTILMPALNDEP